MYKDYVLLFSDLTNFIMKNKNASRMCKVYLFSFYNTTLTICKKKNNVKRKKWNTNKNTPVPKKIITVPE